MLILGIETSCDDTAGSIVKDGKEILSNEIYSQSEMHSASYGGVFPEMASRWHLDAMGTVLERTLQKANCTLDDIDAIAVTKGPGLIGSLLIGMEFAKGLAWSRDLPLIGVDHLHAHLYSAKMTSSEEVHFPLLGLVVSGGHTAIFLLHSWEEIDLISTTRDDAAGEAFDKTAKMLALGYPGGPKIESLAKTGDPKRFPFKSGGFKESPMDFSFSGIKTQVLRTLQEHPSLDSQGKCDLAASFQEVVLNDIATKLKLAVEETGVSGILVGGGVACNRRFQEILKERISKNIYLPSPALSGDNAAMIAGLAFHLSPSGTLPLDFEPYARGIHKRQSVAIL